MTFSLLGDPLRIFAKRNSDGATCGFYARTTRSLERALGNLPGWDVFVTLNPSTGGGKKARDTDVKEIRWLLLDYDVVGEEREDVPQLPYPHVFTGRGHHFWLPIRPTPPQPLWRAAASRFLANFPCPKGFRIDTRVGDPARVARLPGSRNSRSGRYAEVLSQGHPGQSIDPALVLVHAPTPRNPEPIQPITSSKMEDILVAVDDRTALYLTTGASYPSRHDMAFRTAVALAELGLPPTRTRELVSSGNRSSRPEPLPSHEIERIVQNAYRRIQENA